MKQRNWKGDGFNWKTQAEFIHLPILNNIRDDDDDNEEMRKGRLKISGQAGWLAKHVNFVLNVHGFLLRRTGL